MIESEYALKAVYQRLDGDATLEGLLGPGNRIHEAVAPLNTAPPFIVIDVASATDLNTHSGDRVWQDTLVGVTVRGKGVTSTIVPIAERVDELLHGYSVVQDTVALGKFRRERGLRLPPEVENGVRFPAIYQEYRVEAETP